MSVITDMAGDPLLDMSGDQIEDMAGEIAAIAGDADHTITIRGGLVYVRELSADAGETILIDLQIQDKTGAALSILGSSIHMRFSQIYGPEVADATVDLSQASSGIARCLFAAGSVAPEGLWALSARVTTNDFVQLHRLAKFTIRKSAF